MGAHRDSCHPTSGCSFLRCFPVLPVTAVFGSGCLPTLPFLRDLHCNGCPCAARLVRSLGFSRCFSVCEGRPRLVCSFRFSQCFSASEGRRTRVCGRCFSASQGRPSVVCASCCRVCSAPAREDPRGKQRCFSHCCGKQRCFSACCGRGSRSSRQADGAAASSPQAETEDPGAHAGGAGLRPRLRPLAEGERRA